MDEFRNNKGFTLIELAVSILIFALGFLGVAKMQQYAIMGNSFNMQMNNSLNIIDSHEEYLRGITVSDADLSIGDHDGGASTHQGIDYDLAWTVSTTALGATANARQVQITVSWMEKNKSHSTTMNLLRSNTQ